MKRISRLTSNKIIKFNTEVKMYKSTYITDFCKPTIKVRFHITHFTVLFFIILFISGCSGTDDLEEKSINNTNNDKVETSSINKNNEAYQDADLYIRLGGISKNGIIEFLDMDGYSKSEISYALNNISVDWKEQAVIAAKNYNNQGTYTSDELRDVLIEDGFTSEEAKFAVTSVN